jgi:hypothetical protein
MDTHPYYGPGSFVIDSCVPCDVVWLDYGEIELVANAPGRHRGSAYRQELEGSIVEPDGEETGRVRIELELTGLLNALFSRQYGDWEN